MSRRAERDGILAAIQGGQWPLAVLKVMPKSYCRETRAGAIEQDAQAVVVAVQDRRAQIDCLPAGPFERADWFPVQAVIVAQVYADRATRFERGIQGHLGTLK